MNFCVVLMALLVFTYSLSPPKLDQVDSRSADSQSAKNIQATAQEKQLLESVPSHNKPYAIENIPHQKAKENIQVQATTEKGNPKNDQLNKHSSSTSKEPTLFEEESDKKVMEITKQYPSESKRQETVKKDQDTTLKEAFGLEHSQKLSQKKQIKSTFAHQTLPDADLETKEVNSQLKSKQTEQYQSGAKTSKNSVQAILEEKSKINEKTEIPKETEIKNKYSQEHFQAAQQHVTKNVVNQDKELNIISEQTVVIEEEEPIIIKPSANKKKQTLNQEEPQNNILQTSQNQEIASISSIKQTGKQDSEQKGVPLDGHKNSDEAQSKTEKQFQENDKKADSQLVVHEEKPLPATQHAREKQVQKNQASEKVEIINTQVSIDVSKDKKLEQGDNIDRGEHNIKIVPIDDEESQGKKIEANSEQKYSKTSTNKEHITKQKKMEEDNSKKLKANEYIPKVSDDSVKTRTQPQEPTVKAKISQKYEQIPLHEDVQDKKNENIVPSEQEAKSIKKEQKINSLIQEVQNSRVEIKEESKKQIIKYLEAEKKAVKQAQVDDPVEQSAPFTSENQLTQQPAKFQRIQSPNPINKQNDTEKKKQMDTTTIIFIIVLTFLISIPIFRQIGSAQDNIKMERKDTKDTDDTNANQLGYESGQRFEEDWN